MFWASAVRRAEAALVTTVGRQLQGVALRVLPCEELTHGPLPLTHVMPAWLLMLVLLLLLMILLLLWLLHLMLLLYLMMMVML